MYTYVHTHIHFPATGVAGNQGNHFFLQTPQGKNMVTCCKGSCGKAPPPAAQSNGWYLKPSGCGCLECPRFSPLPSHPKGLLGSGLGMYFSQPHLICCFVPLSFLLKPTKKDAIQEKTYPYTATVGQRLHTPHFLSVWFGGRELRKPWAEPHLQPKCKCYGGCPKQCK